MGKYTEDAKELLQYVGGKENIGAVAHCMTRMRFVLNDPKKADISKKTIHIFNFKNMLLIPHKLIFRESQI